MTGPTMVTQKARDINVRRARFLLESEALGD